jgi:AraC-like DNA-binding protein
MNLRSSTSHNSVIDADSGQRIIKIEETSAYHRSKHRAVMELERQVTADSVKTKELLTKAIGIHRIESLGRIKQHRFDIHHFSTGNVDLVEIQWDGAFELIQNPLATRYVIYLVLAGSLNQKINTYQTVCCSPATATIVNSGETVESVASEAGAVLLISIDLNSIDSTLAKLLDRTLKQPVIFQPNIDLTRELGLSLKKFVQFLWETADPDNSIDFSSLVLQKLEQAFLACAIEGLPSNYSEELRYQHDGALSCHVRKAQIFIESNLHEDLKLGDIVAAVGVCSRLLQKAFSHHCGCSPMRFLTEARLQRIRQELERSAHDTKIVDVMMDYGFTQGGKFAKEYQQLFGEKPSETLKRSGNYNHQNAHLWQTIDDPQSERLAGGQSLSWQQSIFQPAGLPPLEMGIWLNSAYFQSAI